MWQANARGEYSQVARERKDDPRCLLRATIRSDAEGHYTFRSVLAGAYPGRPSHIHYRVSRRGYRTLVTQLYFERERGVDAARVATLTRGTAGGVRNNARAGVRRNAHGSALTRAGIALQEADDFRSVEFG